MHVATESLAPLHPQLHCEPEQLEPSTFICASWYATSQVPPEPEPPMNVTVPTGAGMFAHVPPGPLLAEATVALVTATLFVPAAMLAIVLTVWVPFAKLDSAPPNPCAS
jgi:hypothetical protein